MADANETEIADKVEDIASNADVEVEVPQVDPQLLSAVQSFGEQMQEDDDYNALRDRYNLVRNKREQSTFAMLMRMDPVALTSMRKEFFVREDMVTLDEFIYIIEKHINQADMNMEERKEFVADMFELFKDIDVNGDGNMEWSEFTTFTVEKANLLNKRLKFTNIANYHDTSHKLDPSALHRHRHDYGQFCIISPLYQFAILEDNKNSIFFFSAMTGKLVKTVVTEAVPQAIVHVECMGLVVSACADMTMTTHSVDDINPNKRYQLRSTWATPGIQMALAFIPAKEVLYSGGANGNIYAWDIKARNLLATIEAHKDIVMSLIVLPHLNTLASASLDTTIGIWDVYTHSQIIRLRGHKKGVFQLSYNSEYRLLLSCGFDHDVCVWSPFVNNMIYRLKGHHATLVGCHCVVDTNEVITADAAGVFKLWDIRNFQCIQTFFADTACPSDSATHSGGGGRLNCFFHVKIPSMNANQLESDSRIFAAAKTISSFDQARVIHEVSTDFSNVQWISWSEESNVFITASETNIIIWDAFAGSKVVIHPNICGHEISACCLDDRKRKIIIGDVTGGIGVYNRLNGELMKSISNDIDAIVVCICYVDETRRFIVGFSNGFMQIYNEDSLEDCGLICSFDMSYKHADLVKLCFSPVDRTVVSFGVADNVIKFWDYDTGKCDSETNVCDATESVFHIFFLDPYPILVTSDTYGNILIWGSRASRWPGTKLSGFLNLTPVDTVQEKRSRFKEDGEEPYRRVLPVSDEEYGQKAATMNVIKQKPVSQRQKRRGSVLSDAVGASAQSSQSEMDRMAQQGYIDSSHAFALEAEKKWGKVAPSEAMAWDFNTHCLYTGDEQGHLKKWDLTALIEELDGAAMLAGNTPLLKGELKNRTRNQHSALVPLSENGSSFLIGRKNTVSFLGVEFVFSVTAHDDRIMSMCATASGVLTSAADKLVKMWSLEGLPIGLLLQSVPIGVRNRSWDLCLDIKSIIKSEEDSTQKILANTFSTPHLDIDEADLSGLEPGSHSATFSQSELRQRITKTKKKLGVDFLDHDITDDDAMSEMTSQTGGEGLRPLKLTMDHLDASSDLSSLASTLKGSYSALSELKSVHSANNTGKKNKLLTDVQIRRKDAKVQLVAKIFESKSNVRLPPLSCDSSVSSPAGGSMSSNSKTRRPSLPMSPINVDSFAAKKQMSFTALARAAEEDASSVFSALTINSSTSSAPPRRSVASVTNAREKSKRVALFENSCKKFSTFNALDRAVNMNLNEPASQERIAAFKKQGGSLGGSGHQRLATLAAKDNR